MIGLVIGAAVLGVIVVGVAVLTGYLLLSRGGAEPTLDPTAAETSAPADPSTPADDATIGMVGTWTVVGILESAEGDDLKDSSGRLLTPGDTTFTDTWTAASDPACTGASCSLTVINRQEQPLEFRQQGTEWIAPVVTHYTCDDGVTSTMATGEYTLQRTGDNTLVGSRQVTTDNACGVVLVQRDQVTAVRQ